MKPILTPTFHSDYAYLLMYCPYFHCFCFVPFPRSLLTKPKSEMTPEELQKREEEEFNTGPLSVLTQSVKNNTQVLINCRNNKKLLGRVKAFDRYWTQSLSYEVSPFRVKYEITTWWYQSVWFILLFCYCIDSGWYFYMEQQAIHHEKCTWI